MRDPPTKPAGNRGAFPPYRPELPSKLEPAEMPARLVQFRKMNGLGNEFIVFDAREATIHLSPAAIRRLGGATGIGFDQMIAIERSPAGGDAFMRIHNRDG